MKIRNATQAIIHALIRGRKLTTLNGFADFGTSKLPTRIGEVEKKYGVRCNRKEVHFTSKYGVKGMCYEYQLPVSQRAKLAKSVKR